MILVGILIAYMIVTAPFLGVVIYRVYKSLKPKEAKGMSVNAMVMESKVMVLDEIRLVQRSLNAWFPALGVDLKDLKKDSTATLQALTAITKAMTDIKITAETFSRDAGKEVNVSKFVQHLEYARDKYTKTPTQKKAIQGVISNVITQHGNTIK